MLSQVFFVIGNALRAAARMISSLYIEAYAVCRVGGIRPCKQGQSRIYALDKLGP